jgi:DNA transformation protein and related proteins
MAVSKTYREETLALLGQVAPVTDRSMFGGVGIYSDGLFFALMDNDRLYFKVDDSNRGDYEAAGKGPFMPFGDESHVMQYYEVPADVMEDTNELSVWVDRSVAVARAKKKPKRK